MGTRFLGFSQKSRIYPGNVGKLTLHGTNMKANERQKKERLGRKIPLSSSF